MNNYLYHNVLNIERLKSIIDAGYLFPHDKLGCICFTRCRNYLSNRGIRITFDRDVILHNNRMKPFSQRGHNKLHGIKFVPQFEEAEERVYGKLSLKKCIKIVINKEQHRELEIVHEKIKYVTFR